ncbi:unnamed protein product, partial [Mesorhabditis belari]|uniref:Uncharacterized protein n=1 Tax=Mesorhabditis belari TaxID=2138241 RepID=A0AAF3EYQ8_9BILA
MGSTIQSIISTYSPILHRLPLFVILALTPFLFNVADGAVKCFCDRSSCSNELICSGDYCVIGLKKEGEEHKLIQMCADGSSGKENRCDRLVDNWQELCHCSEDFCNTFAHLRSQLDEIPNSRDQAVFSYSDPMHPVHSVQAQTQGEEVARNQRSSLIVLLVIIPLSVGGMAVCLIFLNYHCKMC